jgi:vacuolar-type H+-ATPase subunit E/Vma4
MSTQKVTDKILANAKGEAEKILEKYKNEAKSIADDYEKRIAEKKKQIEDEVEKIKKTEIMRALSHKKLEVNKKIIGHKRKLINDTSKTAMEHLIKNSKYVDFLTALIKNSGEKEGSLLLSRHDAKQHRKDLEKYLHQKALKFEISISDEIKGGVVIKKGKKSYIGSLDTIMELLSDEMAIAVSKILYERNS